MTAETARHSRPKASVGGRYGVSAHTRAMVADELLVCACEIETIHPDAARHLLTRAAEIRRGDAWSAVVDPLYREEGEPPMAEATADPVKAFLDWLIAMDEPDNAAGMEARRTVTLTRIINHARDVKTWHELNAATDDRVAELARLRAAEDRGIWYEEQLNNHVPRDMWRGFGISDYEPA